MDHRQLNHRQSSLNAFILFQRHPVCMVDSAVVIEVAVIVFIPEGRIIKIGMTDDGKCYNRIPTDISEPDIFRFKRGGEDVADNRGAIQLSVCLRDRAASLSFYLLREDQQVQVLDIFNRGTGYFQIISDGSGSDFCGSHDKGLQLFFSAHLPLSEQGMMVPISFTITAE